MSPLAPSAPKLAVISAGAVSVLAAATSMQAPFGAAATEPGPGTSVGWAPSILALPT